MPSNSFVNSRFNPKRSKLKIIRDWIKLCLGFASGVAFIVQIFVTSANSGAMFLCLFFCLVLLGEKTPADRLARLLGSLCKKGVKEQGFAFQDTPTRCGPATSRKASEQRCQSTRSMV